MVDPYVDGSRAHKEGKEASSNPYLAGTADALEWLAGYVNALIDDISETMVFVDDGTEHF